MSIQEQPVHYDIREQKPSSSTVINRGNEEYDPYAADDDEHENEQLTDAKHQKQEPIRINNGTTTHPVINNINTSSRSAETNEQQQQSRRKSKSPIEHQSKSSDSRSRSPHHNHNSSDRKRLRHSSPDSSITPTVNNNESSNTEIISSSKHKSYRNDNRKKSKHYHRYRSSSVSSSSKSPILSSVTSNNNINTKKSSDSKGEKSLNSSDSRRSSKRDDYHSHRYNSSRNYHSTSKYSSRDYSSSSPHQSHIDRRTTTLNISSPSRIPSTTITSDGNSSVHNNESNDHQTSKEDRNRIYNRLKNVNDTNTPPVIAPINNSNKTSSSGPAFINSNNGSQRSRSNLIQIVTTEATPVSTHVPPVRLSSSQIKPELIKSISVPSAPAKIEPTTNTNDSSKSTTTSKTNGGTADDMLMEEMLLEEEQEQSPVKSIDLDSLTIPETSTEKTDIKNESIKVISTASLATTTISTTTTATTTSASSLTPSPTKKPYTLYKVPHTNHTTPPRSSREKKQTKKEPSIIQSDTANKSLTDDSSRRTSLDERILTLFSVPSTSSNKPTNSSNEQQLDTRPNLLAQTITITSTSTPSDKSTESPQDIKSLISTMVKKERDHPSLTEKLNINEERRSTTSKHYTTEWLASQKPEEAPTEELIVLPSLVTLPTLVSSQSSTKTSISNTGEAVMLGKLSEAMSKLIQKQGDTNIPTTTETEDAVPMSAKHLERLERRKQREKRQSEIAAIAKEALKPAFKKRAITKDEYKEIMKKVVTKATHANEVDRIRIGKMIDAYVEKYRTIRQHNTSKTSTISNVNGS